jgi:competence protein ComEC
MLTAARPPVVRAAVLISVLCVARLLGRRAFDFNTLAFAALILLAINPTNLFQTGTQLSFLAVATLACAQPLLVIFGKPEDPLQRLISQSRPWPASILRRCASVGARLWLTSTVIWLVAMPLVMYRFHLVSPIAMLLNPIIWLPMTLALFSGFGVLFFGWWLPPLADACGWFCDQNLFFIESCVNFARELPGNHAWIPSPPTWWVLAFYGCLASGLAVPRLKPPRMWAAACAAAWFAIGFAFTVGPFARINLQQPDQLSATFVAVGHGTSVLVELPDGKTMLYDSGRLGSSKSGVRPISSVLWSSGITHLDAVIISHADADHYNALPGLMKRFSVGVVYVSPVMFRDDTPALNALRAAIAKRNVPLREIDSTDELDADKVQIEILHPPRRGVLGNDNANSIVLRLIYDGRSILLPGDLETPGLEDVMAELPLNSDVVMAPHHGSVRSDPKRFSAWSTPEVVVVSGGHERGLRAVRTAYASRGASIVHTAEDGAIRIALSSAGIHAAHWHGGWHAISVGHIDSPPVAAQLD